MAESGGDLLSMSLQRLDEELTCPICMEHFKEPKVLPCCHYYCKTCVADLIKRAKGRPFNCPECRREIQAANNDPEIFPTAFFVNRMKEVFLVMKKAEPKENVKCESCSELPSIAFCHQCSEYICTDCAKAHKKMRKFSTHEVISIDSLRTTLESATASLPVVTKEVNCSKHKDEQLKLYCFDCCRLVCRDCIVIDHKDHSYKFVVDAAPQCKLEIKEKSVSVKKISVGLKSTVKALGESEKKLSTHCTATMKAIDDAVEMIVAKLMQKKCQLKDEAQQKVDKAKKEITIQEKNAQLAVGEVESLLEFMNRNLERATDQEVLSLEKQMSDQVERVAELYRNPAGKFPVPQVPQLHLHCSPKVEQVIDSDISITDVIRPVLVQRAAYGDSTPSHSEIVNVSIQPLEIPLDPLLVQSIKWSPSNLEQNILRSQVTMSADEKKGKLIFSPTGKSQPTWRKECQERVPQYLAKSMTKEKVNVPKEVAGRALSTVMKLQGENPSLRVELNSDGTEITVAGETSCVLQAKDTMDNLCSELVDAVSIPLSPEDYDLQYVRRKVKQEEQFQMNQLVVRGLPDRVEKDVYELKIADCLDMDEEGDFQLEIKESSALITFAQSYSAEELQTMIDAITGKQVGVTVEMVKATKPSIHVCNITTSMCDDEFLRLYFGSAKMSGGGEIEDMTILGETEALITFVNPAVIQSVLGKQHPILGPWAVIKEYGGNSTPSEPEKVSLPLEIQLDPLLVQSIKRNPSNLEQSIQRSQVTLSPDEKKGILIFSPTGKSQPSWRQECQEFVPQYLAGNMTKEKVNVPKDVAGKAMGIVVKLQKENPSLRIDLNSDGTEITVAGETSCVMQAKKAMDNLCSELVVDTVSIPLSPEDYDFAEQVKQHDFPDNVEYTFDPNTFSVTLKGPVGAVTQLKDSMEDVLCHADSPVMLEPLVAKFFKTQAGRGKLEKFLQDRQCHAAIYFSQFPNLTLHILSDRKEAGKVKAVIGQLPLQVRSQAIQIPQTVQPILSDLEDFIQLCQCVEEKHGVLIKHVGHEISAAGFKAEVTGSLIEIRAFLNEKASPLPPLEIKVGILIARSLNKSPHGIQKCLQSLDVRLYCDTGRGILQLSPLHYLKPGWEEACRRTVSEYIHSNIAEVKVVVPEKAYSDVMTVLYGSEQDDGTLVYQYPPQATSLSLAGEPNNVKLTKEQMSHICANHSFTSDELVLTPEQFEFLHQLKMQDVAYKYHNVEIEPVPEKCSLNLSGPTKLVKAAKEGIPSLTAHTAVSVQLSEHIIHFLASEKGKERLITSFLRERISHIFAVYISPDSPVKLSLLCAQKHKHKTEKVSKALLECTLVTPLQIPDLLLPFFSELSEFSNMVKRVEKDVFAKITVRGRDIVVAGFKDGVSQATDALLAFVKEKVVHFQPIQVTIDPLIAKCMQDNQDNLDGLQACVSSIQVTCTLKQDTKDATVSVSPSKETSSDWKEECKKLLSSYIDMEYLKETIEIPNVAANDVFPFLFSTKTRENFHFESSDDGASAVIAGKRSVVNDVRRRINGICSQKQTSEIITLSHRNSDFFIQVVQPTLKSKDIKLECSPHAHSVTVSGSVQDVTAMVKLVKETIHHKVVPVMVDECVVHFIHGEGKQSLETSMQRQGIKAAIHLKMGVQPPTVELLCHQQYAQQVENLAESFSKKIGTISTPLPKTLSEPHVSQEFQDHYQQLAKEYSVLIQTRKDELQICGFKDKVGEAKKAVEKYIKQKCTTSRPFPIQKGMWRLLVGPMKPKWIQIRKECSYREIVIKQPSDEEEKILITLRGDKVEVQNIIESMNQLVKSIKIAVIPLISPEIRRYFKEGEDGGMKIPRIEKNAHVCIEICMVGEDTMCGVERGNLDTEQPKLKRVSSVPKLKKQCTAQVVDMKRITIYVGDITAVHVDVIVNAANEELKHVGGVADAILKVGGQEIQVASDRYIKSHGRLVAGEVWLSTVVGQLPCLALIHAVGPRWHGNPSGKQELKKVYMNCLKFANAYTSIALPAISSGVFGCPIDQCAEVAISTIKDFCIRHRSTSLDDIIIVLYRQSDVPNFVQALESHIPPQNITYRRPDSTTQIASSLHVTSTSSGYPTPPNLTSGAIGGYTQLVWGQKEKKDEEGDYMIFKAPDVETDIELRIFGETEDCVKSAEDSVRSLISKQYITDEIKDGRIQFLTRSQENTLQHYARRMQLTFRIDRNFNSIELKGSKESIAEMKLKVLESLSKAEKEISRKETLMKTVQWKKQDSDVTDYGSLTNRRVISRKKF